MRRPLVAYRISLGLFIAGLILSGLTAFPLLRELALLYLTKELSREK